MWRWMVRSCVVKVWMMEKSWNARWTICQNIFRLCAVSLLCLRVSRSTETIFIRWNFLRKKRLERLLIWSRAVRKNIMKNMDFILCMQAMNGILPLDVISRKKSGMTDISSWKMVSVWCGFSLQNSRKRLSRWKAILDISKCVKKWSARSQSRPENWLTQPFVHLQSVWWRHFRDFRSMYLP